MRAARRRARGRRRGRAFLLGESIRVRSAARIAEGEVVVDPLRPRHEVEREEDGVLPHEAPRVLEPLEARLGRLLGLDHLDAAPLLVARERRRDVRGVGPGAGRLERVDQRDRVLHGELGPRADGEVSGVGGVADEDRLPVHPGVAAHGREDAPDRAVGQQVVAVEVIAEQFADVRHGVLLARVLEPRAAPGLLRASTIQVESGSSPRSKG